MAKHKKHKKAHHMRRNAAAATASIPRAIVVRRKPTATELAEAEHARQQEDSRGWRVINALGGGVATTIAGALLEHQAALPPKWVTLAIAGLGGALALGAPNRTVRRQGMVPARVPKGRPSAGGDELADREATHPGQEAVERHRHPRGCARAGVRASTPEDGTRLGAAELAISDRRHAHKRSGIGSRERREEPIQDWRQLWTMNEMQMCTSSKGTRR
ncbi:MAG: hypothetical protein E6J91_18525 [Deltaproteobacteria bacterium]|nr:MAG: hypothetical protein E6J91_18525 [Deltaproteobacteria bacterium]